MRASSWKHCLGLLLFLNSCLQSFAGGPESLLIVPQPQQATTGSGAVEVDSSITATVTSAVDLADTASDVSLNSVSCDNFANKVFLKTVLGTGFFSMCREHHDCPKFVDTLDPLFTFSN